MRRFTTTALALALTLVGADIASAQTSSRFRPPNNSGSFQRRVIVQYRFARQRSRSFRSLTEARRFQSRLRRIGYSTGLTRQSRTYIVRYRQIRFRQRTFTGRNALRSGISFRNRLRRAGYETRIRIRRGVSGPFVPFNG